MFACSPALSGSLGSAKPEPGALLREAKLGNGGAEFDGAHFRRFIVCQSMLMSTGTSLDCIRGLNCIIDLTCSLASRLESNQHQAFHGHSGSLKKTAWRHMAHSS